MLPIVRRLLSAPVAVRAVTLGLLLLGHGPLANAEWYVREWPIMGTRVAAELWADDPALGERALETVRGEMERINVLMSHYRPESQLSQVNLRAGREAVVVDVELFALLRTAVHYSEISQGAFDITYASVGYLYDYRQRQHPTDAQIAAALPGVDYRQLLLDADTHSVRFGKPGMRIDLGGLAKGYAVDRAIALLKGLGIRNAYVSAGGDSYCLGDRRGRPWVVGIRHPDREGEVVLRMPLADVALSTSGDYERYFDEGGTRYHHILDPRTGKSPHAVRSVTILAPTATQTDGLSKTVFILGPVEGLAFIDSQPGIDAVVVDAQGKVWYSKGLAPPAPRG
jgi:FAD:protein FMN transferase